MLAQRSDLFRRHVYFLLFAVLSALLFLGSLKSAIRLALTHDYDSQIFITIPVSVFFVYRKREQIFSNPQYSVVSGIILSLLGQAVALSSVFIVPLNSEDYIWVRVLALLTIWISGFIFFYGLSAFRAARFPLLFLLLLLPIPNFLVEHAISLLQRGSAFIAFWFFRLLNVPVMREGMVFHIPSLDLEVSRECSGIHSSVVLLITAVLFAEFALRSAWRKLVLILCVIPIVILKNGVRIVTISLLSVYVNRGFLHGWLHKSGGVVFYLLGLLLLVPIFKSLKTGEIRTARPIPLAPEPVGQSQTDDV